MLGERVTHDLVQGSDEWVEFRPSYYGASEAAVMLALSSKTKRSELLHMKHTATAKEFGVWVQKNILDYGHEVEEMARPIIEQRLGLDLYPVVCSRGKLSASCDGLTLDDSTAFEHKQWNKNLAAYVRAGSLPDEYMPQCQQVLMVTGADKLIFVVSDGTYENMETMYIYPDPAWFSRIVNGWSQFEKDLAAYVPPEIIAKPVADAIMSLPAVVINVTGELSLCNLKEVVPQFDVFLSGAKTKLTTDEDFANGEATAKFSRTTAKTLKLKAEEVVDQISTVSEAVRTLELYADKFDKLGLLLEKAVKEQKQAIKEKIQQAAILEFKAHVDALDAEISPIRLNAEKPNFTDAMKSQRNLSSLSGKVSYELARVKILADANARDIRKKLAWYAANVSDHGFLFSDLQQIIAKPFDDFTLLATSRVESHKTAEAVKLEAIQAKIRIEEEAKAAAKANEALHIRDKTEAVNVDVPEQFPNALPPPTISGSYYARQITKRETLRPTDGQIIIKVAEIYQVDVKTARAWIMGIKFTNLKEA